MKLIQATCKQCKVKYVLDLKIFDECPKCFYCGNPIKGKEIKVVNMAFIKAWLIERINRYKTAQENGWYDEGYEEYLIQDIKGYLR